MSMIIYPAFSTNRICLNRIFIKEWCTIFTKQ